MLRRGRKREGERRLRLRVFFGTQGRKREDLVLQRGGLDLPRMTAVEASNAAAPPDRRVIVTALGVTQILAWGSTFYLLGVLANPIARDTGWGYEWVMAGVSAGLLVAGIVSPRVGRAIGERGGRPVLAAGAILLALGLLLLGSSQSVLWYLAAWIIVGAGMGAGLYDAAFSALGSIYGKDARGPITWVTLFGGFASTVCWPLSAFLVEHLGWRGACLVYAGIQLGFALPIHLFVLPRRAVAAAGSDGPRAVTDYRLHVEERAIFLTLSIVLTLGAAILSMIGMHLLPLLQARGIDLGAAVALGMIVGPSQVGARVIEMLGGRHYHPIWTMVASTVLVAIGTLLYLNFPIYALTIILYGAGNGIGSIARGTLPMALFGPQRYPVLMGRLALPILLSMSLSPLVGAFAFKMAGADGTLALLAAIAAANVLLVAVLWSLSRRRNAAP
jgi:predicted MFS family arabinose efflux permease